MGFDTVRFVPPIPKQVICQICKLVLKDPLQVF